MLTMMQTEAQFLRQVKRYALDAGWLVFHCYDTRASDGKGFPDLTMVRAPRVIFAELKSQTGAVRFDQRKWLNNLDLCGGVETYLWRPSDMANIVEILEVPE